MRFAPTETQEAVAGVAAQALGRAGCTWSDLAEAGLLALPLPQEYDGEGLGLPEVATLLRAVGHHAATHLPVWETLVCGVLPVVAHGTPEQQKRLLAGVAAGETRLAAALSETGEPLTGTPCASLTRERDHWRLDGLKVGVGDLSEVAAVLVSAISEAGPVVVLVDPAADGVEVVATESSREVPEAALRLTGVRVGIDDVLGGPPGSGEALLAFGSVRDHARAGLVLLGDGLLAGARDLSASYVKERRQFGRALAEFQAVAMQLADVYVASRTVGLAATSAAWRVGEGLPAEDDLAVAAYWLCAQGPPAIATCHHVHGGMGVDVTYPLPRYSAWLKDVVRLLGGEEATLAAVPVEETEGKNLELSEDARAFKAEARTYFEGLVPPEDRRTLLTERHGETFHRVVKQMGRDGWMGVGWPTEYGGRGLGEVEQQVFANEAARADVHLPSVTLQTVGPTLMAHGTEEQKERFLGPILSGDVHFAIGYSEPDAGTDLASLRTTARREGDEYVVNGQKMWTTGGHAADYVWLAVRTDPDAPKHKGISVLIVDTKDPGYSWTPIITADNSHHVNATYYSDVRVPVSMRVGEENEGWRLITSQLNHERVMLAPAGRLEGLRDTVLAWARDQRTPNGERVADLPDVRRLLGRMTAAFRVNELLNWQVCEAAALGEPAVADASASKVFASEQLQSVGRLAEEVVAVHGDPTDAGTAELRHFLDSHAKRFIVVTFGGGVNEVQRELVCLFGLGLPRVPR